MLYSTVEEPSAVNWTTVLASAAVGVLVSSIFTLIGQYLERKARRDELILVKALEAAQFRSRIAVEVAKSYDQGVGLENEVVSAATYVRWLKALMKTGQLPQDAAAGLAGKHYDESEL